MGHADNDRRRRMDELRHQIETHPLRAARWRWDALTWVHLTLLGNHADLVDIVDAARGGLAVKLTANIKPDRDLKHRYYGEVYRALHNFLAAAVTLVDQTRNLASHEPPAFQAEYDRRKQPLTLLPVVSFMKDLRNVFLHAQYPPLSIVVTASGGSSDVTGSVGFQSDRLLSVERSWSVQSRSFIEEAGERVVLREAASAYLEAIDSLYGWLYPQFETLHGEEVSEVNALIRESNKMGFGVETGDELADKRSPD